MKLCQKCANEIIVYARRGYNLAGGDPNRSHNAKTPIDLLVAEWGQVPESECEFWAHKALNEKQKALERIAESVGGKEKLETLILGAAVREDIGL